MWDAGERWEQAALCSQERILRPQTLPLFIISFSYVTNRKRVCVYVCVTGQLVQGECVCACHDLIQSVIAPLSHNNVELSDVQR